MTSGCFYPRSNHWEVGGRPQCDKCGCRVRIAHSIVSRLWRQFQTTGIAIRGSVVVVHEEPHPQMTGTSGKWHVNYGVPVPGTGRTSSSEF
ncbi:hypothetical protein TNCV_3374401 [Trichonephila clavipes]|nr:hypothetical protein TNCV_3374401 [Trichonephila clavipes]